jgi:serine/threonine protein kinase/Tol biopolymer transport system component
MTGHILSHYRILDKLGEGGMGVVYKAEDTRLDRTVALKFLAPHLLESDEHKQRFLREAKAAASLDHPNICMVHEVDEVDGQTLLAMQFIEGQSLKDKIRERPLPVDEALDIAIGIARGLQAAHRKQIVHRDIKSANILLDAERQVKITDFGLARLADRTQITQTGAILGTPAYLSPEQARGEPADARSDIWSLGVVLYEMLTGRLPFEGERDEAVLLAILNREPEPVTARRAGLQMELERIIGKALAKNPAERYQHIADMLVDLRRLGATPFSERPRHVVRSKARIAWGAAAACAAIAAVLWFVYARRPIADPSPVEFSVFPQRGTTFPVHAAGHGPWPAVSPDGRLLAFVALRPDGEQQIWVRPLESSTARPLPGTQGAMRPFWSPDGRSLAYFANGQLWRVDLDSGAPRVVCDAPYIGGLLGSWGDDVILFHNRNGLHRVPAGGGPATIILPDSPESKPVAPEFLPGGRRFLYLGYSSPYTARASQSRLCVASLNPGEPTCFANVPAAARYAAPGYLLFMKDRTLLAQSFDHRRLALSGEMIPLPAVRVGIGPDYLYPQLSVSASGVLAYFSPGITSLVWLDRSGALTEVVGAGSADTVSGDGRRIVVSRLDPQSGNRDLWLYDRGRGTESRFTFDPSNDLGPVFSYDGEHVLFASDRSGAYQLYQKPASGAGDERLVAPRISGAVNPDWSSDGRFILYQTNDPSTNFDLWAFSLTGDPKPFPVARTQYGEREGRFSPNVRWVAYDSTESGTRDVWVQPFPPTGTRWQISTGGGTSPRWGGDGKELFYVAADGMLNAVAVKTGPTFEWSAPRPLFQTMFRGGVYADYQVSRDGKRFLMNVPPGPEDVTPITVVLNWTGLLRK